MRTLTEIKTDLAAVEAEHRETRDKLMEIGKRLKKLHDERCALEHGVKVGIEVRDRDGRVYLVTSIRSDYTPPWVFGTLRKKDGTYSKKPTSLFNNWRLLPAAPVPTPV